MSAAFVQYAGCPPRPFSFNLALIHRVAPAPVTGVGERPSYLISLPTTVKPAPVLKYLDGAVTNIHVQIAHIVNDNSSILKLTY